MKPKELLQLLDQLASLAPVNRETHFMGMQAAQQLATFIDQHTKEDPASTPPCPTTPQS